MQVKEAHYRKHPEWKWCSKEKKKMLPKRERSPSVPDDVFIEDMKKDSDTFPQSSIIRSKSVPANELRKKSLEMGGFLSYPQSTGSLSQLAKVRLL